MLLEKNTIFLIFPWAGSEITGLVVYTLLDLTDVQEKFLRFGSFDITICQVLGWGRGEGGVEMGFEGNLRIF